jgi:hypothetical protein
MNSKKLTKIAAHKGLHLQRSRDERGHLIWLLLSLRPNETATPVRLELNTLRYVANALDNI